MRTISLAVASILLAACNKGDTKEATTSEAKGAKAATPTAPTATTPSTSPTTTTAPSAPSLPPSVKVTAGAAPSTRSDVHEVYSLVDNRLSAHLTRHAGLLVPAGSAGFAKYTRFGNLMKGAKRWWELRQSEGDIKVARMVGKSATVFVPVTAAQVQQGSVRVRIHSDHDGTLSLKVNDGKDINGKVSAGWSTVSLAVPAGQLKEGENSLALFMKTSGAEVAWLQVGGADAVGDDGATKLYDPAAKALVLPKDGGMSWFVAVPDKAVLVGDVAGAGCSVDVVATAEDGTSATGKLGGGKSVDLSAIGGKAARLDLLVSDCDEAQLADAAIALPDRGRAYCAVSRRSTSCSS